MSLSSNREIIDISLEIDEEMVVYPGNPEPSIEKYRQLPEDSTTESKVTFGSHTGTHVDAPLHVEEEGETVKEMELDSFYGDAQVLNLTDCVESVSAQDLREKEISSEIVLLKTDNTNHDYKSFRKDFTYMELSAVKYLVEQQVQTLAIDYLSLVEFDGGKPAMEAHKLANQEMTVIEGVDLRGVEPGTYTFSGMPLKLGADGSPMRAALIED